MRSKKSCNTVITNIQVLLQIIDDATCMFTFKPPSVDKTLYTCFCRAKRRIVMVRLHVLSSWLPKHKGFARRYARKSCYGFRVTSEVTSSILLRNFCCSKNNMIPATKWYFSWVRFHKELRLIFKYCFKLCMVWTNTEKL